MSRKHLPHEKRILALFPDLLGIGGIQEAGRLTARALHEIVLRRGWSASFLSLNDLQGRQVFRGGECDIPFHGFGRAKISFLLAALGEACANTRIVLALHPHLAVPIAGMKLLRPRIKSIVVSHGVEIWTRLSLLRRSALLLSDLALAPSRYTAGKLSEVQGIPNDKIRPLAWPLNPSFARMASAPADLPLPKGFPRGRVVLTVGRWISSERYKGVDDLIRATLQLRATTPGLNLVAVGGGDDLPRLKEFANRLGVADCVHFLENSSRAELAACYANAEIFALPSTGEGFGFVFLEAMAFAKPVVGAATGGITDIVESNMNGLLVPPRDNQRLCQALDCLLKDEQLRKKLGQRGAEVVRQKFQFEVFKSELHRILDECGMDSAVSE